MSMDDISQDEYYGTPKPTPMRRPVTGIVFDKILEIESMSYFSLIKSRKPQLGLHIRMLFITSIATKIIFSTIKNPSNGQPFHFIF